MLGINRVPAEALQLQYALDGGFPPERIDSLVWLAAEMVGLSANVPLPARVAAGRLKLMAALQAEALNDGARGAVPAQARGIVVAAAAVLGGGLLVASAARGSDPLTTAWELVHDVPMIDIGGRPAEVPTPRESAPAMAPAAAAAEQGTAALRNDATNVPLATETPVPPATRQAAAAGVASPPAQAPTRPPATVQPAIATQVPARQIEPVASPPAEPTRAEPSATVVPSETTVPANPTRVTETPAATATTRANETPVPTATTRSEPPEATRPAVPAETPAPPDRGDDPVPRRVREPAEPEQPVTVPFRR